MYNPQLETFLRVADAGSFNKAVEESHITPTAVIKQLFARECDVAVADQRLEQLIFLRRQGDGTAAAPHLLHAEVDRDAREGEDLERTDAHRLFAPF